MFHMPRPGILLGLRSLHREVAMLWFAVKAVFFIAVIGAYVLVISLLGDGVLSLILKVWLTVAVIVCIASGLLGGPERRL